MNISRLWEREIAAVPDFSDRGDHHSFIGGGTPSVPDPSLVGEMLDQIRNKFFVAPDAEITIEANPGTLYKKTSNISGTRNQPTKSGTSVPAESGIKDPWKDPYVGRVSGELFYGKGCRLFQHQY